MAENNIYNAKDSIDINELASLNDDISPDLIEQLQQKLQQDADSMNSVEQSAKVKFNVNDDTTLFEEQQTNAEPEAPQISADDEVAAAMAEFNNVPIQEQKKAGIQEKKQIEINTNFDDNFIKKYKAKLNKQKEVVEREKKYDTKSSISNVAFSEEADSTEGQNIEELSNGNITEQTLTQEQKDYNDSLDFLDNNVKYSKYVIYIEPQNTDFIDSLTLKERKNLINKVLKEQSDVALTKRRFKIIHTVIKHIIVSILTVSISIPVIYWVINNSLEATINNYRNSQSNFQILYKQNGKITKIKK